MKKYEIIAAEEIVAEFKMEYENYDCTFKCSSDAVKFIINQHPELKGCPNRWRCESGNIIFTFCSIGNPVIQEIQ